MCLKKEKNERHVVFHVPHDGGLFPKELVSSVCVPPEEFLNCHRTMRDLGVSDMVPEEYRSREFFVRFPVSRLLCDVERFIGPEEVMERYGMGYCYENGYDGLRIKNVTEELKEKTLVWYRKHHERLDALCLRYPRILLIDLHSYSDEILQGERIGQGRTPDICIGTDRSYTPDRLTDIVCDAFSAEDYSVKINDPYEGCMVPNAVFLGRSSCDCISVMIEIHKRTYLDGTGMPDGKKTEAIRMLLEKIAEKGKEI